MAEREREPDRETTIIQTGERSGGAGVIIAIVLLAIVAVVAFVYFSGGLRRAANDVDVNVNVTAPKIELPDINVPTPAQPAPPANKNSQ